MALCEALDGRAAVTMPRGTYGPRAMVLPQVKAAGLVQTSGLRFPLDANGEKGGARVVIVSCAPFMGRSVSRHGGYFSFLSTFLLTLAGYFLASSSFQRRSSSSW